MTTYDPRGISVVVRACGKNYKQAVDRAMQVLELWYGDAYSVKLYAINVSQVPSPDPAHVVTERGQFIVHALGLHRDGENVECDPNTSSSLYLPHDTPCVHGKHAGVVLPGEAPTSTLGQNRGGYVAIENGDGWRGLAVQPKTWFQVNKDGEIWPSYKLPGHEKNSACIVLP